VWDEDEIRWDEDGMKWDEDDKWKCDKDVENGKIYEVSG
jgi:hypothetical protein